MVMMFVAVFMMFAWCQSVDFEFNSIIGPGWHLAAGKIYRDSIADMNHERSPKDKAIVVAIAFVVV